MLAHVRSLPILWLSLNPSDEQTCSCDVFPLLFSLSYICLFFLHDSLSTHSQSPFIFFRFHFFLNFSFCYRFHLYYVLCLCVCVCVKTLYGILYLIHLCVRTLQQILPRNSEFFCYFFCFVLFVCLFQCVCVSWQLQRKIYVFVYMRGANRNETAIKVMVKNFL